MKERMYHGKGYHHSGKHDRDCGLETGSNETKRRTIKREKKRYNRGVDKYERAAASEIPDFIDFDDTFNL